MSTLEMGASACDVFGGKEVVRRRLVERIRKHRDSLGYTTQQVTNYLGQILGRKYDSDVVAEIESGRRQMKEDETHTLLAMGIPGIAVYDVLFPTVSGRQEFTPEEHKYWTQRRVEAGFGQMFYASLLCTIKHGAWADVDKHNTRLFVSMEAIRGAAS